MQYKFLKANKKNPKKTKTKNQKPAMKILSFTLYMFVVGAVIIKQLYYWTPQKPVQRTTRSGKCREWFCSFQFINCVWNSVQEGRKRRRKQCTYWIKWGQKNTEKSRKNEYRGNNGFYIVQKVNSIIVLIERCLGIQDEGLPF